MAKPIRDAIQIARRTLAGRQASEAKRTTSSALRVSEVAPHSNEVAKGSSGRSLSEAKRLRNEAVAKVVVTYGHATGRRPPKRGRVVHVPSRWPTRSESPTESTRPASKAVPEPAGRADRHFAERLSASAVSARATPPVSAVIIVSPNAKFLLGKTAERRLSLLRKVESAGLSTQCHVGKTLDEREIALGLDFGTSSVKVVVGDAALGKAFAIPFFKGEGIAKFLLPSRLYQTKRSYSLESGKEIHRDLKLSLLANPDDPVLQERVIAFLALVIRRARGWLLTEHLDVYSRTRILWKLAVGLPTAQHLDTDLSRCFRRLSQAAWRAADSSTDVTHELIRSILLALDAKEANTDDLEVAVVPEIAAQIYGFVVSTSFDRGAPNIFLMADVGAGTVDSSLFHVKPGKHGRWDFEFFTSVVEPNGVSNLHRDRVNWWHDELTKTNAPHRLLDRLSASKLPTDQRIAAPESFLDYFAGVRVNLAAGVKSPDEVFFNLKVLAQVQGKSFWRAWKDGLLHQQSLTNVPFFMCGGGMRMKYYQALESRLAAIPGCTWLKAECWTMGVPNDLVAEGVEAGEFDRLSVAYGLSRLEIGKVVRALPKPRLVTPPVRTWRDNYVDKDHC